MWDAVFGPIAHGRRVLVVQLGSTPYSENRSETIKYELNQVNYDIHLATELVELPVSSELCPMSLSICGGESAELRTSYDLYG